MNSIFKTERLVVRNFTVNDYDNHFLLTGNADVMRYIRPIKNKEESDLYFNETVLDAPSHAFQGRWAVEEKDTKRFIGSVGIIPIPDDVTKTQMGYSFLPEYWGKGLASELVKAGLEYFKKRTPLPEIYGITETENIASQKVLLKNGFVPFGKKMEGEIELLVFVFKR
ncbi:MAG: GNAT family N-acetyltransferase [Chitinophagaceae bacterium]